MARTPKKNQNNQADQEHPKGPVLGIDADIESTPEAFVLNLPAELPAGDVIANAKHVEANHMTQRQRRGMRRLVLALDGGGAPAQLENGKYVQNGADAVRWFFEQITIHVEGPADAT